MFNPKWRLRANKFSLGLAMGIPGTDELWEPYYGRIFDEWADEYIFDDEDRLEILEECFSAKIAETLEGDDRPVWHHGGASPIKDYSHWLAEIKKARLDKKASCPLGKVWLVPREQYVAKWRTKLIPKSGDDLIEYRGKSRTTLGKFTHSEDKLFVGGTLRLDEKQIELVEETAITWLRHGTSHAARASRLTHDKL